MEFDIEKYHLKSPSLPGLLSSDESATLKSKMLRKEFVKGDYIFRENNISRGVYIIRKGKVKIFRTSGEGRQSIVYFYRKGDFFGHRPLLGNEPNPVSAVAMDNVVLSYIPRELFLKLLEESDSLARGLLVYLSKEFSVWINKTTAFAQYNVKRRVALSLLILEKVFERRNGSARKTSIFIHRDDFANYVGTAKETLVRMLRFFKDEGIIASSRTSITILKPRLLVNMVEDL